MIGLIKGKEVLVVGAARSGMAAVELLSKNGASKITITDQKQPAQLEKELAFLKRYPCVETVTGGNLPGLVHPNLSIIIKSPGVPPTLQLFKKAEELGVPVISEIELAYNFIKAPLVGVTGTNGKTTVTSLITAMLKEAQIEPVVSAGNVGNPLSGVANKISAQGMIVAELSSFQLANIRFLRPAVAVFLNFAEDHIDYHGSIEKYYQAKLRIFENQLNGDYAVLNAADHRVASLQKKLKARVLLFNRHPVSLGVGVEDGRIKLYKEEEPPLEICLLSELLLPGEHNLENALAASAASWACGADLHSIAEVLRNFRAIEHRLEHVAAINGVDYINDSKGTNPGATIKALKSFPGRNKILIAGGKDKGSDFSALAALLPVEVSFLILLGETKDELMISAKKAGFSSIIKVEGLEEAVSAAHGAAKRGDVVLLSPACASWDMFPDFEARGNLFKKLVRSLPAVINKKGGGL